jgi:hypothetical protein
VQCVAKLNYFDSPIFRFCESRFSNFGLQASGFPWVAAGSDNVGAPVNFSCPRDLLPLRYTHSLSTFHLELQVGRERDV